MLGMLRAGLLRALFEESRMGGVLSCAEKLLVYYWFAFCLYTFCAKQPLHWRWRVAVILKHCDSNSYLSIIHCSHLIRKLNDYKTQGSSLSSRAPPTRAGRRSHVCRTFPATRSFNTQMRAFT